MTKHDEKPLSSKAVKYFKDSKGMYPHKDVASAVERLKEMREEIYDEMQKPIKDQLESVAFKTWLLMKLDEIDEIFGSFE